MNTLCEVQYIRRSIEVHAATLSLTSRLTSLFFGGRPTGFFVVFSASSDFLVAVMSMAQAGCNGSALEGLAAGMASRFCPSLLATDTSGPFFFFAEHSGDGATSFEGGDSKRGPSAFALFIRRRQQESSRGSASNRCSTSANIRSSTSAGCAVHAGARHVGYRHVPLHDLSLTSLHTSHHTSSQLGGMA